MTSLHDLLGACDAAVRGHLDPGEQIRAIGRCEDITERGGIESGGAAWTYIMVTNRRLRWVPQVSLQLEASLDFEDVTAVSDRVGRHRYAIALEHAPLIRPHWAPAHRLLVFQWGDAIVTTPLTRTELAFSRRDTKAAVALRAQLAMHHRLHEHS